MIVLKSCLYCVHGFLGKGSDWTHVLPTDTDSIRFNLFNESKKTSVDYNSEDYRLSTLGQWVNMQVRNNGKSPILVGYSLGGRISLHSLISAPELYRAAIIISAHPGLSDPAQRAQRRVQDGEWAMRFKTNEWRHLVSDWNAQPTLRGSQPLLETHPFENETKDEDTFSRSALTACLQEASLGRQENLREALKALALPILWIAGETDSKFVTIAQEMQELLQHCTLGIIKNAGHRAPWDQPESFNKIIIKFINSLSS